VAECPLPRDLYTRSWDLIICACC